jgi:selenophosphate synthase
MSKTYFKPIQLKGSAIPNFFNLQVVANVLRQVLESWPDSIGLGGMQATRVTKYALVLSPSSYAKESNCGCLVFGIFSKSFFLL